MRFKNRGGRMIPKFRVWDKQLKIMRPVVLIDFTGEEVTYWFDEDTDSYCHFTECILMQSIGLKDKNGVEIFEGDIVKYNLTSLNKTIKGFVVFARGGYFIMTDGYNENINLFDKPKHLIEVLGNIYENPELLEKR